MIKVNVDPSPPFLSCCLMMKTKHSKRGPPHCTQPSFSLSHEKMKSISPPLPSPLRSHQLNQISTPHQPHIQRGILSS